MGVEQTVRLHDGYYVTFPRLCLVLRWIVYMKLCEDRKYGIVMYTFLHSAGHIVGTKFAEWLSEMKFKGAI